LQFIIRNPIKEKIQISPRILHKLRRRNDLKLYAVWLCLKRRFSNSCFYNYTIASFARTIGLSRTSVKKYISIFLRWEWCRLHAGNLVFCKHTQLPGKQKNKKCLQIVSIGVEEHSIEEYLLALQSFSVEDALRKQQFARARSKGRDKAYRAAFRENNQWEPFTVKRASELFSISHATASRWLRKLANKGWFQRVTIRPWLQATSLEDLLENKTNREKLRWAVSHNDCGDAIYHTERFSLIPYKGNMLVCYPSYIRLGCRSRVVQGSSNN
jgi:hypothetical protein